MERNEKLEKRHNAIKNSCELIRKGGNGQKTLLEYMDHENGYDFNVWIDNETGNVTEITIE